MNGFFVAVEGRVNLGDLCDCRSGGIVRVKDVDALRYIRFDSKRVRVECSGCGALRRQGAVCEYCRRA